MKNIGKFIIDSALMVLLLGLMVLPISTLGITKVSRREVLSNKTNRFVVPLEPLVRESTETSRSPIWE